MDEKDQSKKEASTEPQAEALEIDDGDLEVVTGGVISHVTDVPPTDPCITSIH